MAYRKKTLRTMSPTARKVARLIGELESVSRRLKNLIPDIKELDFKAKALESAKGASTRWEKDNEVHAVHDPVTDTTIIE